MNVRVEWKDSDAGYEASYDVPDMHKIDPDQGNIDASGIYEHDVYSQRIPDLDALGIGSETQDLLTGTCETELGTRVAV